MREAAQFLEERRRRADEQDLLGGPAGSDGLVIMRTLSSCKSLALRITVGRVSMNAL
jgi:hypothetical protein